MARALTACMWAMANQVPLTPESPEAGCATAHGAGFQGASGRGAALCAAQGIPFVWEHARSMTAIHGGQAKHAQLDAHKMALVLRGGRLPQADV